MENEESWYTVRIYWSNSKGKIEETKTQHKGIIAVSRMLITVKHKRGYEKEKIEIMRCENIEDYWFL